MTSYSTAEPQNLRISSRFLPVGAIGSIDRGAGRSEVRCYLIATAARSVVYAVLPKLLLHVEIARA